MDFLELIEHELRAYRETGRAVHLAHVARALEEARSQLIRDAKAVDHVDSDHKSRE
jgi:hypothetical protein